MCKLVVAMLLATLSHSALAGWEKFNRGGGETAYVDRAKIRKAGNVVEIWVLRDFDSVSTHDGVSITSVISREEHDCKQRQVRYLHISTHSARMGAGQIVSIDPNPSPHGWEPVIIGTPRHINWSFACDWLIRMNK